MVRISASSWKPWWVAKYEDGFQVAQAAAAYILTKILLNINDHIKR